MPREHLVYQEHHWKNATYWSLPKGDPRNVAERFIDSWNRRGIDCKYPTTPEFTDSVAGIIKAARKNEKVEIIPDGNSDDLCKACGACRMVSLPECR